MVDLSLRIYHHFHDNLDNFIAKAAVFFAVLIRRSEMRRDRLDALPRNRGVERPTEAAFLDDYGPVASISCARAKAERATTRSA